MLTPSRNHSRWTEAELTYLQTAVCYKMPFKLIAEKLGRGESSCAAISSTRGMKRAGVIISLKRTQIRLFHSDMKQGRSTDWLAKNYDLTPKEAEDWVYLLSYEKDSAPLADLLDQSGRRFVWTSDHDELMERLMDEKASDKAIAKRLNITVRQVKARQKALGWLKPVFPDYRPKPGSHLPEKPQNKMAFVPRGKLPPGRAYINPYPPAPLPPVKKKAPEKPWTAEEDAKLLKAVRCGSSARFCAFMLKRSKHEVTKRVLALDKTFRKDEVIIPNVSATDTSFSLNCWWPTCDKDATKRGLCKEHYPLVYVEKQKRKKAVSHEPRHSIDDWN